MSEHTATIEWRRETPDFDYETYNRDHDRSFDAGITVRSSAALNAQDCQKYPAPAIAMTHL
jgi:hypothetical protein